MLLKLYKSNQPFVLLFLPIIAIVFWINSFIHPVDLSAYYNGLLAENYNFLQIKYNWVNTLLAIVFLLAGAVLLNSIANKQKFTDKENYLPAFFYVLLNSLYFGQLFLSPVLVANFFLLLALQRFLNIYRQNNVFSECFDTGFLLAIAVVFYLPYLFLFPIVYLGLIIVRSFSWREWVLPVLGFCSVFLIVFVYLFVYDMELNSLNLQFRSLKLPNDFTSNDWVGYSFLILTCFITILSFLVFIPQYGKSTIQEKNAKIIFVWLLFFLIFIFALAGIVGQQKIFFGILSIPIAICFSFYFYLARKRFWVSLLFYCWLGLLLFNFYF
jgi:Family of unknown function (DUF6427)